MAEAAKQESKDYYETKFRV